jgi:hypothetical protein
MKISNRLAAVIVLLFVSVAAVAQPFKGDEWINLLGKREATAEVAKVLSYVGDNGNPKGMKITIQNDIVTRLDFYNDDNPWGADIQRFAGTLPKGLEITSTIAKAKEKLGEGFETEGEVSGTYTLHKNFELNNVDAYQVNLEYLSGRLNAIGLIYMQGDAKKFDQTGTLVKGGIKGDDVLHLVKKNIYSKIYEDLQTAIGPPNHEERYLRVFATGGVEINFGQDLNISKVIMYSGGQPTPKGHIPTYSPYTLQMPYGLRFEDSRADVITKAGQPTKEEDGAMVYNDGYTSIKVFVNGKVSRVELSENKDFKIDRPANKTKPEGKAPAKKK